MVSVKERTMSDTVIIVLATALPTIGSVVVVGFGLFYKVGKKDGETAKEIKNLTKEVAGVKTNCSQQMGFMNGKITKVHERVDKHLEGHPVVQG